MPRLRPAPAILRGAAASVIVWAGGTVALAVTDVLGRNYLDFDFFPMWLAGRAVTHGIDIYDPPTWLRLFVEEGSRAYPLIAGTGFGYPMPSAVLMVPLGLLPFEIAAAAWAAGGVVLGATGVLALSRWVMRDTARDAVLLAGLTAATQPVWVTLVTGQTSVMLIGLVAHATALLAARRHLAAGLILGLLLVKPHVVSLAIAVLIVASPHRVRLIRGMLALTAPLVAVSFIVRPDWPAAWLRSARALQDLNVSRANAFGLAPEEARWLGWVLVALLAWAFVTWWRSRPPVHVLWAGALPLSLFAAPYSWSYDQGILIASAAVIVAAVAQRAPRARVPVIVALAAIWVVTPWLLYVEAHRSGAEPAAAMVPAALLALLIAVERGRPQS